MRASSVLLSAALSLSALTAPGVALAADYLGVYVPVTYDSLCGKAGVLNRVTSGFRHQVRNVPNLPQVEITEFQQIYERRYEPATYGGSDIPRHYCQATVSMSDGYSRTVYYLVEEGMGFVGMGGNNVEFCVPGFDRWHVYNGACRVVK
ncbi:hypothetical protein [Limoniibacter endophyticus]|nr:hypothetical protein [Limoniibacter endophyticus]